MVLNPALKSGDYRLDIAGVEEVVRITQPAAGIGLSSDIKFAALDEENALGEYTINIRNFDGDNKGATIEVIGPNGIPIEKKAVEVGEKYTGDFVTGPGPVTSNLELFKHNNGNIIGTDGTDWFTVNDDGGTTTLIAPASADYKDVSVTDFTSDQVARLNQEVTIGGLLINTTEITGAGTVKVSLEMRANFSVYYKEDNADPEEYERMEFNKEITSRNGVIRHGGFEFNFDSNIQPSNATGGNTTEFALINNALAFQIGPNTNQNVMIDIPQLDTVRLGIERVDVTTQEGANEAIFILDRAVNILSDVRAKLGATQNRMEHTINNLQVTHENLTASESRIRDADMALEMTEFTKNNILNQSATAMLAQANQLPQGVLQLLQ
ncbi:flagellin [Bacillus sp. FJAT-45350]|uniref:flagellin n=1 Tax=Bacillus sp. FJAT-45350 TaxID=2011014 RepID=UPI00359C950D